jgi:hypothetical protein
MIVALIALIVALGGTGYAAVSLRKNSVGTRQLKKNAVTTAKIKNGAVTGAKLNLKGVVVPSAASASYAATAGTATNAGHASSADSATNATSATSATDATHLGGIAAARYITATSTLASGDTETGVFAAAAPSLSVAVTAINFTPKLPSPVLSSHVEEHGVGSTSSNCPGALQAAPGYLCVYEGFNFSTTFAHHTDPISGGLDSTVRPVGVVLTFNSSDAAGNVRGSWAYTAP